MTIPAPNSPNSSGRRPPPSCPPRSPNTPRTPTRQSPNNNSQKLLNDVDLKSITLSPPFSQRHPPSPKRSPSSKSSPSSPQRIRPQANSTTSSGGGKRSRSNSINSCILSEFNTSQRSIHTNNSSPSGSPQRRRTSSNNSKTSSPEKNSSPGQLLMNSNERRELQKDVLLQNSLRRSESGGSERRRSRSNSGRISSEIGETLRTIENDDDDDTYEENVRGIKRIVFLNYVMQYHVYFPKLNLCHGLLLKYWHYGAVYREFIDIHMCWVVFCIMS